MQQPFNMYPQNRHQMREHDWLVHKKLKPHFRNCFLFLKNVAKASVKQVATNVCASLDFNLLRELVMVMFFLLYHRKL